MDGKDHVQEVFGAVADPTRRQIIRLLSEKEELALYELTPHFDMGRTAVSKHLAILREANLVNSRKVGRETRFRLNPKPLSKIQDWVSYYESFWKERMFKLNMLLEGQKMPPDVSLDFQFASSIEQVWDALTDAGKLAEWIWENDFKPIVGHKFQFRSEPNEWWDGIVNCEVLEVDEPNKLSYTWASAGENTIVTWTLQEGVGGSTQLHFEQTGFSAETKAQPGAIEGATHAWKSNGEKLAKVLAE